MENRYSVQELLTLRKVTRAVADLLRGLATELVLVDVNKGHNKDVDTKYGHPTQSGLPVVVVLDADGKRLTTQDTGKLEEGDHHSPEKVMAFLKEWAPKR